MAISFTTSYTFSSGTTISSSQMNTNFSDNTNTWTGLEGLTKSFSNLRVDATPTTSTDVAIKSYVDKLNAYRRPVLQFGSVTTVAVESGLDGTSGDIPLLFPDGTLRTETSTTRTTFDITRNAVLTTSGAQSGLTGATSEAANTWYALYGVKVTDSSTLWVTVGSTVLPLRANFTTLNTAYGTNGWVYLGLIRNGDADGATSDILSFSQTGNTTLFQNGTAGGNSGVNTPGIKFATTASGTSLAYTYASGTGAAQIPANITNGVWSGCLSAAAAVVFTMTDGVSGAKMYQGDYANTHKGVVRTHYPTNGNMNMSLTIGSAGPLDIYFSGFLDGALGVGANPLL